MMPLLSFLVSKISLFCLPLHLVLFLFGSLSLFLPFLLFSITLARSVFVILIFFLLFSLYFFHYHVFSLHPFLLPPPPTNHAVGSSHEFFTLFFFLFCSITPLCGMFVFYLMYQGFLFLMSIYFWFNLLISSFIRWKLIVLPLDLSSFLA